MTMLGFLRRKKKEPERKAEEKHEVSLEKMHEWVGVRFGGELKSAAKRAADVYSDTMESLSKVRDRLADLEKASFGGSDKAYVAANMTKNSFVKQTRSILEGMHLHSMDNSTYAGLEAIDKKLSSALSDIGSITPKQLFIISKFFKDKCREFTESVKSLNGKESELKAFLGSEGRIMKTTEKLKSDSERIAGLLKQAAKLESEENEVKQEIDRLDNIKNQTRKSLESLMQSREWAELKKTEESFQKSKLMLGEIDARANILLSEAKRPLKKLWHLLESKETFPENPFKNIVLNNREAWLEAMLKSAVSHADEGSISLKPKEREKLTETLAILQSEIPEMKRRYQSMSAEADENAGQISRFKIAEKKDETDKELLRIEGELKRQWSGLDAKMAERKRTERMVQELKTGAERAAQEALGVKLEIRF